MPPTVRGKGPAMSDKIAMLERAPLFAGVDRDVLARIAELTEVEEVGAGTTLTHEGRHEGYFYILVAGTVEVTRGGALIDTGHSRSLLRRDRAARRGIPDPRP